MRLTKVRILNYRSIADVTVSFEPSCRILVGINESGKSNVLRAMSLLLPDATPAPDDLREFGADEDPNQPAFVRFVFQHDQAERLQAFESIKHRVLGLADEAPVLTIGQSSFTLGQAFNRRSESLYQIDIRTGLRSFAGWALPKEAITIDNLHRPVESARSTITVSETSV